MAGGVRMPRTRGVLNGLALVALGAWGGVAPFAGPLFGFGFQPDHAWQYTSGRLYLSALPGAVTVLAGIAVLGTRSRWFGGFCAFIAALAGAWFIAGAGLIRLFPAGLGVASVSTGAPIGRSVTAAVLTEAGFYGGTGAAIVFFAALALGRFTVAAHRDFLRAEADAEAYDDSAEDEPGGAGGYSPGPYVPGHGQYQFPSQYPPADPYPPDPEGHPYPPAGQYPDEQTVTETFGGGAGG